MDLSKIEGKRILRSLELKAYRSVVDALRAQGALTKNKHEVLKNLAAALKVGEERYRSEIRRASNDELLSSIAQCTYGKNAENNWCNESARKIPRMPMIAQQTVFTALADNISDIVSLHNTQPSEITTTRSLNIILDERKNLAESNLLEYHSSKVFNSLLSNKTFRNESILLELEKIKMNNQYTRPDEFAENSEAIFESCSIPCEPPGKTVTWVDLASRDNCNSGSKYPTNEDLLNYNSKVNALSTNFKTGTVRKPITKMTKAVKPEIHIPNGQIFASEESSLPHKKRSVKTKRFEITSNENIAEMVNKTKINLLPTNKMNREKSENSQIMQPSSVIYDEGDISVYKKSRRNKRRPKQRTKSRTSKVSGIRKLNSVQRTKTNIQSNNPNPVDVRTSQRRKTKSTRLIDVDFMLELSSSKKKKVNNNSETKPLKTEEVEKPDKKKSVSQTIQSESGNSVEVSYNNAISKTPAPLLNNFELNLTPVQIEADMKPHTFNLIPASRRLKLLKKRATSPFEEVKVPTKRTANQNSVITTTTDNNISGDRLRDVSISESAKEISSDVKSTRLADNYKRTKLLPSTLDQTTKTLSLLGNIKIRNLSANAANILVKPDISNASLTKKVNSSFHAMMELSSDSLSEDERCTAIEDKYGGFLGFARSNGLPDNVDSDSLFEGVYSDISESSNDYDEEEKKQNSTKSDDEQLHIPDDIVTISVEEIESTDSHNVEPLIDIESADVIIGDQEVQMSDNEMEQASLGNVSYNGLRVLNPEATNTTTKEATTSGVVCSEDVATSVQSSAEFVTTAVKNHNDSNNYIVVSRDKKSPRPVSDIRNSTEQKDKLPMAEKIVRRNIISSSDSKSSSDVSSLLTPTGQINADIFDKLRVLRHSLKKNQLKKKLSRKPSPSSTSTCEFERIPSDSSDTRTALTNLANSSEFKLKEVTSTVSHDSYNESDLSNVSVVLTDFFSEKMRFTKNNSNVNSEKSSTCITASTTDTNAKSKKIVNTTQSHSILNVADADLKSKRSDLATIKQTQKISFKPVCLRPEQTVKTVSLSKTTTKLKDDTPEQNSLLLKTNLFKESHNFSKNESKSISLPQIPKKVFQLYEAQEKDESISQIPLSHILPHKTVPINKDALIEISSKSNSKFEISDDVLTRSSESTSENSAEDVFLVNESD